MENEQQREPKTVSEYNTTTLGMVANHYGKSNDIVYCVKFCKICKINVSQDLTSLLVSYILKNRILRYRD